MNIFFNSKGDIIKLNEKIGEGGEGNVYKIDNKKDRVAKIYHKAIADQKQNKIIAMTKSADNALRKVTAWPLDTLHKIHGGNVCGFIMPDITGSEVIHHIYSPSHRKQHFPDMDWSFLVNTCRNIAAAFASIHSRGHVIGDVNPNLVFISNTTIANLIDCDSFQILYNGKIYPCEVGVPHFTPPELQNHTSFKNIIRTKNHDNFGLALLIFHVLMMGRHPFSGVYSGNKHIPLEKSIQNFLYAFSDNPIKRRQISPPPNSITPNILPDEMRSMFEQAFSESGSKSHRPTANEWIKSIDSFKQKLKNCTQSSIHKYYNRKKSCPWCNAESQGVYYFLPKSSKNNKISGFNRESIWSKILSIKQPKEELLNTSAQLKYLSSVITPKSIPQELVEEKNHIAQESIEKKNNIVLKKIAAILIIIGCYAFWPQGIFFSLFPAGYLFFSEANSSSERQVRYNDLLHEERQVRYIYLLQVEKQLNALILSWDRKANTTLFKDKVRELKIYYDEHKKLHSLYQSQINILQRNKRELQLNNYLKNFYIRNAIIRGVGDVRKSTLASFGIETAADVQWSKVINVPGFGEAYTREIVDWRKSIERMFIFNPDKAIDPSEISRVKNKITKIQLDLENKLLSGPEQLQQIYNSIIQKRNTLSPQITTAMRKVAHAKVDLKAIDDFK